MMLINDGTFVAHDAQVAKRWLRKWKLTVNRCFAEPVYSMLEFVHYGWLTGSQRPMVHPVNDKSCI